MHTQFNVGSGKRNPELGRYSIAGKAVLHNVTMTNLARKELAGAMLVGRIFPNRKDSVKKPPKATGMEQDFRVKS